MAFDTREKLVGFCLHTLFFNHPLACINLKENVAAEA
jgi:hypothetical protein